MSILLHQQRHLMHACTATYLCCGLSEETELALSHSGVERHPLEAVFFCLLQPVHQESVLEATTFSMPVGRN